MDKIDYKILQCLEENSRSTAKDISNEVNLSIPAVSERIRKLECSGTIEKYTLKINRKQLGYTLLAFVYVNIDYEKNIQAARKSIIAMPEVLECHHMAGEYDYLLKVLLKDTEELEYFISLKLKKIKGVLKTNTLISLLTTKEVFNRQEEVDDL